MHPNQLPQFQGAGLQLPAPTAAMKAQLYFNANVYIRKEMWTECAKICQDIIDGKYILAQKGKKDYYIIVING